jgi:MFS family permease
VPLIPPLLRENRAFRQFFLGQAVSLIGDQITLLALPLTAVLVLHANAARMGYLTTAALVPNLLFSLHAGAWVDRRGRRRQMMLVTDVGRGLLVASVPVAYALGHLTWAQLYVVAFGTGTLSVLFFVAYGGLFQSVVPRERYVEANSLLHGSRAFSFLAGSSVGGALVQALRGPYALAVDAVSFFWSALFLGRMHVEEPPGAPHGDGGILAGGRWIRSNAIVRAELLGVATLNYFNFIFFALFVLYATKALHIRPATLGLVLGTASIGTLGGSFVTSALVRRIGLGPAFALGCFLFPAPLILVAAARGPHWLVIGFLFASEFCSGVGLMILDITAGSLSAALVPVAFRSRVAGAFMVVNYGVRPLGTMSAAALGSLLGLHTTMWIATVGAVAGVLWVLPSPVMKLRDVPGPEE